MFSVYPGNRYYQMKLELKFEDVWDDINYLVHHLVGVQ